MGDLPAKHYLGIYRQRLGMVEKGITHPPVETVNFVKELIAGLSVLQPETKIRLESQGRHCCFTVADNGALLAEITFPDAEGH